MANSLSVGKGVEGTPFRIGCVGVPFTKIGLTLPPLRPFAETPFPVPFPFPFPFAFPCLLCMMPFVSGWRGAVDRRPPCCWGTTNDGVGGEGGRMEIGMGMGMGRVLDAASSMASRTSLDGLAVAVALVVVEDSRSWLGLAPRSGSCSGSGPGSGERGVLCLFIFVSDASDRVLSTGEGGRGTCVGASGGASGPGASASGGRRGII